jgi:hypothetical protein
MTAYLTKLDDQFDIDKLINEVNHIMENHKPYENQISLNHRPGFKSDQWSDGCGSPFPRRTGLSAAEYEKIEKTPRFVDTDFTEINDGLHGTEIENVLNCYKTKYVLGRYRIAIVNPKTCYGWHRDQEKRIHVAVATNPGSFIITEDGLATHLLADGFSWLFRANNGFHTAINSSYSERRIHLLLNVWD